MCGKQTGMFYFVISLKGLIRTGFTVVISLRVIRRYYAKLRIT